MGGESRRYADGMRHYQGEICLIHHMTFDLMFTATYSQVVQTYIHRMIRELSYHTKTTELCY